MTLVNTIVARMPARVASGASGLSSSVTGRGVVRGLQVTNGVVNRLGNGHSRNMTGFVQGLSPLSEGARLGGLGISSGFEVSLLGRPVFSTVSPVDIATIQTPTIDLGMFLSLGPVSLKDILLFPIKLFLAGLRVLFGERAESGTLQVQSSPQARLKAQPRRDKRQGPTLSWRNQQLRLNQRMVVGRDGDFFVDGDGVSRRHAEIFHTMGRWYVKDLQSTNGTYIKRSALSRPIAVSRYEQVELRSGDVIILANERLKFTVPRERQAVRPVDYGQLSGARAWSQADQGAGWMQSLTASSSSPVVRAANGNRRPDSQEVRALTPQPWTAARYDRNQAPRAPGLLDMHEVARQQKAARARTEGKYAHRTGAWSPPWLNPEGPEHR